MHIKISLKQMDAIVSIYLTEQTFKENAMSVLFQRRRRPGTGMK